MHRWWAGIAVALGLLWSVGCSSAQLGTLAEAGALMAGKNEEESKQIGAIAKTFGDAVLPVTVEQELEIGGGVAVTAFSHVGAYYPDESMNLYVTLVGKAVAEGSTRPDLPYAFAVLNSEEVNAFAGPGGYIFVTVGALRLMDDESQLAGVLAHEVGHVCARHALKALQRERLFQGMAEAGSFADPKNAARYNQVVGAVDDVLFTKGYDKRFEFEADLLGTEFASAMGYNPWGLRQFLYNFYQAKGSTGGWMRTHPDTGQRIQRLDGDLNANYADFKSLPLVQSRFVQYVKNRLPAAR